MSVKTANLLPKSWNCAFFICLEACSSKRSCSSCWFVASLRTSKTALWWLITMWLLVSGTGCRACVGVLTWSYCKQIQVTYFIVHVGYQIIYSKYLWQRLVLKTNVFWKPLPPSSRLKSNPAGSRQQANPKCWTSTGLHDLTSHKIVFFTVYAVRTQNKSYSFYRYYPVSEIYLTYAIIQELVIILSSNDWLSYWWIFMKISMDYLDLPGSIWILGLTLTIILQVR